MSVEVCIVAVDIGNSAAKLAVRRDDAIVDQFFPYGAGGWEQAAIEWAKAQVGSTKSIWRIAAVRATAANQLCQTLDQAEPGITVHQVTHRDLPIKIDVDQPAAVGIDRLLAAFAAYEHFSAPTVVIDAGSAVTVDWVSDNGTFSGGAILPGLGFQSRSLASGTESLPQIDWTAESGLEGPARNTADAIQLGILTGVCSAIEGLVKRYCEAAGVPRESVRIALTGGDAVTLSGLLATDHQVIPNLVCRGLLNLPESMVG